MIKKFLVADSPLLESLSVRPTVRDVQIDTFGKRALGGLGRFGVGGCTSLRDLGDFVTLGYLFSSKMVR